MSDQQVTVPVTFTQQQMELLDTLKEEGTFGSTYPEIVAGLFRAHIIQEFGEEGVV